MKKRSCSKMEEVEILDLFQLRYSELLNFSCSSSSLKLEDGISRSVMEALGPEGPGLLAITHVPNASALRRRLLPLARKLALLDNDSRRRILKDHGLGSDVPLKNVERIVSSFALQLKHVQGPSLEPSLQLSYGAEQSRSTSKSHPEMGTLHEFLDCEFKHLGETFKELGSCMIELGLLLARVCDKAIGGRELERSIMESSGAKGRLIHYHSNLDNLILKEAKRSKQSKAKPAESGKFILNLESSYGEKQSVVETLNSETIRNGLRFCRTSLSKLWQQWHYDYGIFTILTTPMFLSASQQPCLSASASSSPDGHTCLQILDSTKDKIFVVRSPPESFIVQVGEIADILSKGKLCSTLHSVSRPVEQDNLSRETFVVFLQPSWNRTFSISETDAIINRENSTSIRQNCETEVCESDKLIQEIHKIVPPLSVRLKDGMTFAEFSRETTKQYYGGNGMQSKG